MIPISSRFAVPLIGLLALALVPVSLQRVRPRRVDGCAMPEALRATSLIPGAEARGERLERRTEDVIQWSEGRIVIDSPPDRRNEAELSFQIIRTYNARPFYERPVSLVDDAPEPEQVFVRHQETAAGTIPVHVVVDKTGARGRVIAYLFVYGNEPVSMPFLSQVRHVFRELVSGARPLTLFLVEATAPGRTTKLISDQATAWLGEAWEYYAEVCRR